MVHTCAIIDLAMGAGTWAAVAPGAGLALLGAALTEVQCQSAGPPVLKVDTNNLLGSKRMVFSRKRRTISRRGALQCGEGKVWELCEFVLAVIKPP